MGWTGRQEVDLTCACPAPPSAPRPSLPPQGTQQPHVSGLLPPLLIFRNDPLHRPSWTGQSRSQARGRLILGALALDFLHWPSCTTLQARRQQINHTTPKSPPGLPAASPTRTRTRTRGASALEVRSKPVFFSFFLFPLTVSLPASPARPLLLVRASSPRVVLYWHLPSCLCSCVFYHPFLPAALETDHPPTSPPQYLVYQINFSINPLVRSPPALIPATPGTSGPSQLGCGCHHPVNQQPLATRHPKLALSQSNLTTPVLF